MRKSIYSLSVVLVFLLLTTGYGCKNASGQSASSNNALDSWTEGADSACYEAKADGYECRIVAAKPHPSLNKSMGQWLNENWGGHYQGDVSQLQSVVDFYGQSMTDTLRQWIAEEAPSTLVSYEASINSDYETNQVITYLFNSYVYLGGAHPFSMRNGATFQKSDGSRLTWDIISQEQRQAFHEILVEALRSYFKVDTNEALRNMLFNVENVSTLPLPQSTPIMQADGLTFVYQQYEITGYAWGMPTGTIPYQRIKPFLTEWARQLVGE